MKYFLIMLSILFLEGNAQAAACGVNTTYNGRGAGEVVFNGALHSLKGLICSDCHEARGLTPALFEMKKGANMVTMRKIELGRSCGYCHQASEKDYRSCSKCHHK